jgi:hypothetical protein
MSLDLMTMTKPSLLRPLDCRLLAVALVLALQSCGSPKKAGGAADGAVPDSQPELRPVADTLPPPEPPSDGKLEVFTGEAGAQDGARLTIDPPTTNFGTIDPGTAVYISLIVKNVGTAASGALTITHSPELTIEQSSQWPLVPGGQTTLLVSVATTSESTLNGWVAVEANPGATPAVQATVSGVFVPWGPFMVSPRVFELGAVGLGSEHLLTTTVTMRESVTDLTVKPNGSYTTIDPSTTCTPKMAAGAACTVAMKLVVSQAGSVSEGVLVTATGSSTRKTSVVSIRGTASSP